MIRKYLLLPLLLFAVTVMGEAKQTSVPVMIVYTTDGDKQVVQLPYRLFYARAVRLVH